MGAAIGIDMTMPHAMTAAMQDGKTVVLDTRRRPCGPAFGLDSTSGGLSATPFSRPLSRSATAGDLTWGPEPLAQLLAELKAETEERVGQQLDHVVVAVPGWFDQARRRAVREAGSLAGLSVATAAPPALVGLLLAARDQRERRALVVHVGPWAVGASFIELGDGLCEVVATKSVSTLPTANQSAGHPDAEARAAAAAATAVIEEANCAPSDLDMAWLAGKAPQMPAILESLRRRLGGTSGVSLAGEDVVARGAATAAALFTGSFKEALLLDVLAHSLAVRTMEGQVHTIVERNTTLPAAGALALAFHAPGPLTVDLALVERAGAPTGDAVLGSLRLEDLRPGPDGAVLVEVSARCSSWHSQLEATLMAPQHGRRTSLETAELVH